MTSEPEFATLMARVQAGCKESARLLHDLYGHHILRAVRRRLHERLRPKFDSIDFVQDVWASFFADMPGNLHFDRAEDLVAFLTAMASNKVAEAARTRLQRQKYNVNRETPLEEKTGPVAILYAAGPTPSEVLMGEEQWQALLSTQPLVHRRILMLVREGNDTDWIAQKLGISERTVRRVIQKNLPGVRP